MLKAKIVLDKRRERKDGSFPVVIEVRNNDKIRVATIYSSLPSNWGDGKFTNKESNYARGYRDENKKRIYKVGRVTDEGVAYIVELIKGCCKK